MAYDELFNRSGSFENYLDECNKAIETEINTSEKGYILSASEDDLKQYLISKYTLEHPIIHEEDIHVNEPIETRKRVARDSRMGRDFWSHGEIEVKGLQFVYVVPFEGDSKFFHYQPNPHIVPPPRGEINRNEIVITIETTDTRPDRIKWEFENTLGQISTEISRIKEQMDAFNSSLPSYIEQMIKKRKEEIKGTEGILEALGYPIKRREDPPKTYTVSEVKRKPKYVKPTVKDSRFNPEPAIQIEEYNTILEIIQSMVMVMERSPHAFREMKEEDLRQHFLVQLNGQYEGQATGETFNYAGKTDILIRNKDKNVFVAECKFWRGKKVLLDTIDQLLGYTSWRDTKTAIIIFNKNADFSAVLSQIDGIIEEHLNYKRKIDITNSTLDLETTFRYVLHQKDDKNREFNLTVVCFNLPEA